MCNPLLFGTVSSATPICVGRGSDATLQCSKLSSPRDAEKFINRNAAGLLEKWDGFREALRNICDLDTASAKFHCAECNVMRSRVFEINARVLSRPCGSRSTGTDAIGGRIQNQSGPRLNSPAIAK
jgi:hypothetical protein